MKYFKTLHIIIFEQKHRKLNNMFKPFSPHFIAATSSELLENSVFLGPKEKIERRLIDRF